MPAPKGHDRYGGRIKGTPNKATASVRAALSQAFEKIGGVDSLVEWGKENRSEFYKLWIKLLPTQITGDEGGPIRFSREELEKLTDEQLIAIRAIAGRTAGDADGDGLPVDGSDRSGVGPAGSN